jgi:hypothetical protein
MSERKFAQSGVLVHARQSLKPPRYGQSLERQDSSTFATPAEGPSKAQYMHLSCAVSRQGLSDWATTFVEQQLGRLACAEYFDKRSDSPSNAVPATPFWIVVVRSHTFRMPFSAGNWNGRSRRFCQIGCGQYDVLRYHSQLPPFSSRNLRLASFLASV